MTIRDFVQSLIHRGWSRTKRFTDAELEVIQRLLPAKDRRRKQLLQQAKSVPFVRRKLTGRDSYTAKIPYITDPSLLIDCDKTLTSPAVEFTEKHSGISLRFTIDIQVGGFLNNLSGRTLDGSAWPKKWQLGTFQKTVDATWLPTAMPIAQRVEIVEKLFAWSGLDSRKLLRRDDDRVFRVNAPAAVQDILDAETRLGLALPASLKELYSICNWFSILRGRAYAVFGTRDIRRLGHSSEIMVTDLHEDGVVVVSAEEANPGDAFVHDASMGRTKRIGPFRVHVRNSLSRLTDLMEGRNQR